LLWGYSEGDKEVSLSQKSVLDFFTSNSRTHAPTPGLLRVRENDPDDLPTVQEEVPAGCIVTGLPHFIILVSISEVHFFGVLQTVWNQPQHMTGRREEKQLEATE